MSYSITVNGQPSKATSFDAFFKLADLTTNDQQESFTTLFSSLLNMTVSNLNGDMINIIDNQDSNQDSNQENSVIEIEQQIMFISTLYVVADIDKGDVFLQPVNNPARAGRYISITELEIQLANNSRVYFAENILNTANAISVNPELKILQKVQRLNTLYDFAEKQQENLMSSSNHILFAQRTDHLVRIDRKIEILKAQYKARPKVRKVGMSPALSAPFNNTPTLRATYQDATQIMAEHKPSELKEIDLNDHTTWTLQPI